MQQGHEGDERMSEVPLLPLWMTTMLKKIQTAPKTVNQLHHLHDQQEQAQLLTVMRRAAKS
jgi:hypothetical protein